MLDDLLQRRKCERDTVAAGPRQQLLDLGPAQRIQGYANGFRVMAQHPAEELADRDETFVHERQAPAVSACVSTAPATSSRHSRIRGL